MTTTEAPATPPPPASPPRGRDWDAWAAAAASLAAVMALLVAAYTANLQRQQVRAQVWPRLQVMKGGNQHLLVWNKGTGPARILSVRLEVDGRRVSNWGEFVRAFGHEPDHFSQTQLSRMVLSAGERIDAFSADDSEDGRALFMDVFRKNGRRYGIEICYCSVLDQCWKAGGGGTFGDIDAEREVDGCPPAKDQFSQ
jgi:hypothetical protein